MSATYDVVLLVEQALTVEDARNLLSLHEELDDPVVYHVLLPLEDRLSAEEQALFDERQQARKSREFVRADAARAKLEGLGVVLEDTPQGTRWKRKH